MKIYVLLGPSGSGKTTIAKRLGIPQIISTTTRDMRQGEVQDETYHFVTEEEFSELDLIEEVIYSGNRYGLQKDDVQKAIWSDKDHYVILDRKGCEVMKELFEENVQIVYLKATPEELKGFMMKRGDSDENIQARLDNIERDKELENDDIADLIVTETDLDVMERQIKLFMIKPKVTYMDQTCGACPSQWALELDNGRKVYVRYRWGTFRAQYDDGDEEMIVYKNIGDSFDGCMCESDMVKILSDYFEF